MRIPPLPPGLYRTSSEETLDGDVPSGLDDRTNRGAPATLRLKQLREADPTFTAWVGQALHEVFDPVSEEPLPTDLAALLRRLERVPPVGRQ
jgi:hypothetical protein